MGKRQKETVLIQSDKTKLRDSYLLLSVKPEKTASFYNQRESII